MFARVKKSGKNAYVQVVESRREGAKVRQHVLCTLGRLDRLRERDSIDSLTRSLSRFSQKTLLVLTGKGSVDASARKLGPGLIYEHLWQELAIGQVLQGHLQDRKFGFDVERALFLTVLHRLFAWGSDRACDRWCRDYVVSGVEGLSLHHLYRAMCFLGEPLPNQLGRTPFSPRCVKDEIEEAPFARRRDLFSHLELVFFDTTSLYFEGEGGSALGAYGCSKDHRPDLKQMVVGVVSLNQGHHRWCWTTQEDRCAASCGQATPPT